jgi:hypothetical protein
MHTILSNPPTYFSGRIPADGRQVIIGRLFPFIVGLFFDSTGTFLEFQQRDLGIDPLNGFGPEVELVLSEGIQTWHSELAVREAPICVLPFLLEKERFSVRLFPYDIECFLAHPEDYSEQDAAVFREDIERWKSAGNCVLCWGGDDHHLDSDGYTI